MKYITNEKAVAFTSVAALCFCASISHGADAITVAPTVAAQLVTGAVAGQAALIAGVIQIVVAASKWLLIPRIGKAWIPLIAVGIAPLIDYLAGLTGHGIGSPILAAAVGAITIGLREIVDQIAKASTPIDGARP